MKALVVDDSAVMRRLHERSLEKLGFVVTCAEDGQAALICLGKETCDIVITDLHMPNLDGFGFIQELRARAQFSALKVLLVTSDGVLDVIEKAIALGANDVLIKPFSAAVFAERVGRLVRGH